MGIGYRPGSLGTKYDCISRQASNCEAVMPISILNGRGGFYGASTSTSTTRFRSSVESVQEGMIPGPASRQIKHSIYDASTRYTFLLPVPLRWVQKVCQFTKGSMGSKSYRWNRMHGYADQARLDRVVGQAIPSTVANTFRLPSGQRRRCHVFGNIEPTDEPLRNHWYTWLSPGHLGQQKS